MKNTPPDVVLSDDELDMSLIWQTRNEMDTPTNPLQELREILTRTSRDIAQDKMLSCIYGIIVGWDDKSYKEFKKTFGWTDQNIKWQKFWHAQYIEAWNMYVNHLKKTDHATKDKV